MSYDRRRHTNQKQIIGASDVGGGRQLTMDPRIFLTIRASAIVSSTVDVQRTKVKKVFALRLRLQCE